MNKKRLLTVMGGSSAKWTPEELSNVALWLDASDLTGNDGDAVTTWTSKEGNAYAFTQATPDNKPLLKKGANGIGNKNTVLFDGTDDYLKYAAGDISNATQGFVAAVFYITTNRNNQTIISSYDEATTNYAIIFRAQRTGLYPGFVQVNNDTIDDYDTDDPITITTPYLIIFISSGDAYSVRLNGVNAAITMATGTNGGDWFGDTENRDNFLVGARENSGGVGLFMKGSISEIIISDVAPTAKDITNLESYLNTKYGAVFF